MLPGIPIFEPSFVMLGDISLNKFNTKTEVGSRFTQPFDPEILSCLQIKFSK